MPTTGGTVGGPVDDAGAVERYLTRPDVPAIVRSENVADAIGVTLDRVERVLMRIAEDRERVTRIRPGAYMVRRKPAPSGATKATNATEDGIGPTA